MIDNNKIFTCESFIFNKLINPINTDFLNKLYDNLSNYINKYLSNNKEIVDTFNIKSEIGNKDDFINKYKNINIKKLKIYFLSLDLKKQKSLHNVKSEHPNFYNIDYSIIINNINLITDFYLYYSHGNKRLSIALINKSKNRSK